jgi:hypothetical protein
VLMAMGSDAGQLEGACGMLLAKHSHWMWNASVLVMVMQ